MPARKQSGVTLMELLVVLVLVGMMATLLLQASIFLLGNFASVTGHQERLQARLLPESWYRDSLSRLVAAHDDAFAFRGDTGSLSGATLAPLYGPPGRLSRFSWRLIESGDHIELWYEQPGFRPVRVSAWRAREAGFEFIDGDGERFSAWPEGDDKRLPHGIALHIDAGDAPRTILTAMAMRKVAQPDYRELL